MRARNIKPGFFSNDLVAELPTETRLLFIGLWMIADREGRLEYRPKKIKGLVFPFDNFNVEPMLQELASANFIDIYEVDGSKYLSIPNFVKHQKPHIKEAPSRIPPKPGKGCVEHLSRLVPDPNLTQELGSFMSPKPGKEGHENDFRSVPVSPECGKMKDERGIPENVPPPKVENQKPKPENQEPLPDRLVADNEAKRIADKYRRMIAPTSTPGNGQAELVKLIVDQRIPAEDLERSVKNFAAWRAAIPKPPYPIHAKTFFGSGEWLNFRDHVPEQIEPPDPHAEEKAAREARDAEWRRKAEIATAREIEALNAAAAANRKAKAQLAGG